MSDEPRCMPYIMAKTVKGNLAEIAAAHTDALKGAGFDVVGKYDCNETTIVVCFTNDDLKQLAAQSDKGGFGAVLKVGFTTVGDNVQVSYNNPEYMALAYRFAGDNKAVAEKLAAVLGKESEFGSKKGVRVEKLKKYQYKPMMPYFNEPIKLGKYGTHEEAVAACDKGLAAASHGVVSVYKVAVPGKEEVVYGVGFKNAENKFGDDTFILSICDFTETKHTPYLVYEMLVSGKEVFMLHGRFRIAVSFPDLEMTGDHGFTKLMDTPGALEKALEYACGAKQVKK